VIQAPSSLIERASSCETPMEHRIPSSDREGNDSGGTVPDFREGFTAPKANRWLTEDRRHFLQAHSWVNAVEIRLVDGALSIRNQQHAHPGDGEKQKQRDPETPAFQKPLHDRETKASLPLAALGCQGVTGHRR
jgi:hypothetical protein